MEYQSITPTLLVDQIEPCLFFWVGRLGFTKVTEVYEDDKLGFVILVKDHVQIMYQTYLSVERDTPSVMERIEKAPGKSVIYIKVSKIDWIEKHLDGVDVVFPKRETPYGATEICVKEPAGNLITFAAFKDAQAGESNY